MINDLNLKTADRISAMLVGLSVGLLPFVLLQPYLLVIIAAFLLAILWLNHTLFQFFLKRKGLLFTVQAFPWQLLYFFYSGAAFMFCWFRYALPKTLDLRRGES
ncbi:MAG: glycosyltransferase family 2 protein, partial [Pyrinomonadaceae bacterium]